MLRILFNERPRPNEGATGECLAAIEDFCTGIRKHTSGQTAFSRFDRLELTAQAFARALDELEQSVFCAGKYAEGLIHETTREMDEAELLNYYRHVYFYKNGFIRVFSTLDKLGYFMNELFEAKTESVKPKFSYFTVLRQLNRLSLRPALTGKLNEYKVEYKVALNRLRKKRNLEIHYINVEMLDDIALQEKEHLDYHHIENLKGNIRDLEQGYDMVCRSMLAIFKEAAQAVPQA